MACTEPSAWPICASINVAGVPRLAGDGRELIEQIEDFTLTPLKALPR
jgi:hypothetical protein